MGVSSGKRATFGQFVAPFIWRQAVIDNFGCRHRHFFAFPQKRNQWIGRCIVEDRRTRATRMISSRKRPHHFPQVGWVNVIVDDQIFRCACPRFGFEQGDVLLKYLVHKFPSAKLGDNGTLEDAYELDHWLAFFTGDVHPAFYPFFSPNRYSVDHSDQSLHAVKEASYKLVDKVFTHLEKHLEGKTHIVSNRRTIVDVYAVPMIRWGNYLPKSLAHYPEIIVFTIRCWLTKM